MEQKPDIIEGVRLLSKAIDEYDNEDYGLINISYEPNPITLGITMRAILAGDDKIMEVILAGTMATDKRLRAILINAVETYKNMANG